MGEKVKLFEINNMQTLCLKAIAIILVISGHLDNYIPHSGQFGVSIFLILSGYGLFQSYYKKNNKNFIKNKLKKVYLPYFIYVFIIIAYNLLKNNFYPKRQILLNLIGLDFGYMIDTTMWYITYIFICYILFYISCIINNIKFKNNKNNFVFTLMMINVSLILYILSNKTKIFGLQAGANIYYMIFPLGVILSQISMIRVNPKNKNIINSIILVSALIVFLTYCNNTIIGYWDKMKILSTTFSIVSVFIISLIEINNNNSIIIKIGEMSYFVYIWEFFIIKNGIIIFTNTTNILLYRILIWSMIFIVGFIYKNLCKKINELL